MCDGLQNWFYQLKRKNRTFACVHGRYLPYQTFPIGGRQTQRYFIVSTPSSRRDNNGKTKATHLSFCLSVRLSVRPSVTKFSQDWIISFL